MTGTYPALRLRRTRASGWSRAMHRENVLTPADLIWPLFVTEGRGVEEPVGSLPGVSRWSRRHRGAREGSGCAGHPVPGAVSQHTGAPAVG